MAERVVTSAHDMSRFWRLVINEGGLVTGTWWVTREDRRGEQHVKPIDVTLWDEGRHSGLMLHSEDFTAFVREGVVEPIRVHARHSHVEAEAKSRLAEIAETIRAVAAAPDWPDDAPDAALASSSATEPESAGQEVRGG